MLLGMRTFFGRIAAVPDFFAADGRRSANIHHRNTLKAVSEVEKPHRDVIQRPCGVCGILSAAMDGDCPPDKFRGARAARPVNGLPKTRVLGVEVP